ADRVGREPAVILQVAERRIPRDHLILAVRGDEVVERLGGGGAGDHGGGQRPGDGKARGAAPPGPAPPAPRGPPPPAAPPRAPGPGRPPPGLRDTIRYSRPTSASSSSSKAARSCGAASSPMSSTDRAKP